MEWLSPSHDWDKAFIKQGYKCMNASIFSQTPFFYILLFLGAYEIAVDEYSNIYSYD